MHQVKSRDVQIPGLCVTPDLTSYRSLVSDLESKMAVTLCLFGYSPLMENIATDRHVSEKGGVGGRGGGGGTQITGIWK